MSNPPDKQRALEWGKEHARNASLAKRRAASPLTPPKAQLPCDVGLFSDDADQLDLVEFLQQPTNE